MNNQEAQTQDELRNELRAAIHGARKWSSATPDELTNAVLPIVTQREAALTEKWAHALDHWGESVKAADYWMGEHAALVEKINALADELDAKALSAGDAERATHDVGAFGDEMVYQREKRVLTYAVRRLRGLVSGDNQAQR